jgi:hypothetical protein
MGVQFARKKHANFTATQDVPHPAGTTRRLGRFLPAQKASEEEHMKLIVTAIAATALLLGSVGTGLAAKASASGKAQVSSKAHVGKTRAHARTKTHVGAKAYAPGQRMKTSGSVYGRPGASGYAPGHQTRVNGSAGASANAPGIRATTGAGVGAGGGGVGIGGGAGVGIR